MSDNFTPFPSAGGFPGAGGPPGAFPPQGAPVGGGFGPPPGGGLSQPPGGPAPRAGAQPPQPAPGGGRGKSGKEQPTKSRRERGSKSKDSGEGKPVTRRLISRQVAVAGVFALVAGLAVTHFLTEGDETQMVVRTKSDVSAGTAITGSLLEAAPLPAEAVEPNAFTGATAEEALDKALDELEGVVTQYPLASKTQLRADQFGIEANLGEDLGPTERLLSIRASVSSAVAGGLSVGNRVDIVGATDGVTRVVAYNVPIVAITVSEDRYNSVADAQTTDREVKPQEVLPGDPVPGIYVVRVPAEIVPALVNWNESATLHLIYRGADSQDVLSDPNSLMDDIPVIPGSGVMGLDEAEEPLPGDPTQEDFFPEP